MCKHQHPNHEAGVFYLITNPYSFSLAITNRQGRRCLDTAENGNVSTPKAELVQIMVSAAENGRSQFSCKPQPKAELVLIMVRRSRKWTQVKPAAKRLTTH